MLKNWSYRKAGDVVDVFEPTARNWIFNGIAEEHSPKQEAVEQAVLSPDTAERAIVSRKVSKRP
jgi:hypothetical protein